MYFQVLILVLMEYGLRDNLSHEGTCWVFDVLILVLMEYGLREANDILSRSWRVNVLILVLMEYGLRVASVENIIGLKKTCLNPCFNGIWSART